MCWNPFKRKRLVFFETLFYFFVSPAFFLLFNQEYSHLYTVIKQPFSNTTFQGTNFRVHSIDCACMTFSLDLKSLRGIYCSKFQASCNSFQVDRAEFAKILFPTLFSHSDTLGTYQNAGQDEVRSKCKVSKKEPSKFVACRFPLSCSGRASHAHPASPRAGFIDAPDKSPPRTSGVLAPEPPPEQMFLNLPQLMGRLMPYNYGHKQLVHTL